MSHTSLDELDMRGNPTFHNQQLPTQMQLQSIQPQNNFANIKKYLSSSDSDSDDEDEDEIEEIEEKTTSYWSKYSNVVLLVLLLIILYNIYYIRKELAGLYDEA